MTYSEMSQESPSSGRRGAPQRDKEFFPAIAKAISRKSGAEGDIVGEKGGKARSERRAGEGSTIKGKGARSAASLLLSASSASTIPMASSSDEGASADPSSAIHPAPATASASLFKRALGGIRAPTLPPLPHAAAKANSKQITADIIASADLPKTPVKHILVLSDQSSDSGVVYMGMVGEIRAPEVVPAPAAQPGAPREDRGCQ